MSIRLEPYHDDDAERLPLGFDAARDLQAGRTYVDEMGNLISSAQLTAKLRAAGDAPKRVVRITFRYRLTTDPPQMEMRRMVVAVPVIGHLTTEELGRLIHSATRNVHKRLRELGEK